MPKMTGMRFIAEAIRGYGVTHVFYVPQMLLETLVAMEGWGIKRVMTHGEKAAAYMADGYARAALKPGVCMAQHVGGSNLAAGLKDAYLACSPVIALTGGPAPLARHRHAYQEIEDYTQFEHTTKFNAHVDAVIYLGPIPPPILGHLIRQGPPAVVADAPEGSGHADVICFDNAAGAKAAAEHLYEMGHREFALITGGDQLASLEREAAAIAYWTGRGVPATSIRRIAGDFSRESGMEAGEQLLREPSMPTGIFCLNDEMAVGLLAALQNGGRCRVPQDVSVIGFDDIFWAGGSVPALTTVRLDKSLLGRLTAQRVLERLQEPSLAATYIRVETQIVLRNSTGPGPAKIGPDVLRP